MINLLFTKDKKIYIYIQGSAKTPKRAFLEFFLKTLNFFFLVYHFTYIEYLSIFFLKKLIFLKKNSSFIFLNFFLKKNSRFMKFRMEP